MVLPNTLTKENMGIFWILYPRALHILHHIHQKIYVNGEYCYYYSFELIILLSW